MKISKKVLIIAIATVLLILASGIPAKSSTFVPVITLQPIITSLIPLPPPTPTTWQPAITALLPIPQNTFEIIPLPIPLKVSAAWSARGSSLGTLYASATNNNRVQIKKTPQSSLTALAQDNSTPMWAIIVLTVLAIGVVVLGSALIYITAKDKNKNTKYEDFGSTRNDR